MLDKDKEQPIKENIIPMSISDIVPQRFLNYAMYVIQERALPDIVDGLTLAPLRSNSYSKLL